MRVKVLNEQEGHAWPRWEMAQELGECIKSPGRGSHTDHRELSPRGCLCADGRLNRGNV
jgi:hypothetical protein